MTPDHSVLFDRGPLGAGTLFARPRGIVRADTPEEVAPAFAALERARAQGLWAAGYASYELGHVLTERLRPLLPEDRPEPLLLFGLFDGPRPAADHLARTGHLARSAEAGRLEPDWDFGRYRAAFDKAHAFIGAGDCYQVNLTFPLRGRFDGPPLGLYHALRAGQPVGHGAFVDLGGPVLLSRSPELFFRVDLMGRIETRPMKGTQPRSADPAEDAARRVFLARDEKNRAENLMIVDLLRNDLARVSRPGSVKVPELFTVESYATVHQMVSRITADLAGPQPIARLFEALFPCGSITGAPKIRAMEIIAELEDSPRGAYCGAIGWMAPGGAMEFSVAIRTLVAKDGALRLNVGGGVVHDSTAASEYEEALWKSRFASLVPAH
ncbi:aminodeoxychorismate synthase component I [Acidimangrovimonas pyrenivorans]|uniref:Aminodeoxychorismate synthase component I n=1 Tax=Acidimangrovimonas pyrenivorans TaxID=2030798 RepID=A0ABV7AIK8_9RHOB